MMCPSRCCSTPTGSTIPGSSRFTVASADGLASVVNLYDYINTRAEVRYTVSGLSVVRDRRSGPIGSACSYQEHQETTSSHRIGDRVGFTFVSMRSPLLRHVPRAHRTGAQDGPLRTIHELLALHAVSRSSLPVDWSTASTTATQSRLPTFDVEGYLDERVGVWDFVSRELLPLLPMSLRTGPRGLYALTADLSATVADALGTLRAGWDCWRVGPIQYERRLQDLTGTIEVQCGNYAGKAIRTVTADGSSMLQGQRARLAQESSVVGQLLSRVQSAEVASGQTTTTIRAPWLAGETGGQYVAHTRLAYQAAQIRTVRYRLAPEFLELEVGDLVHLVDPEVSIDGPAYLSTLEIDTSAIVGTFSLYEPVTR